MVELPSGTVTLLFSDIEGSTALLSRLGAAYADALDGQRQILRAAWTQHGGVELGTEGDSFFVSFATAPDAIGAAVQAQRDLAGFGWPAAEQVRVRMGVHTGNPTVHDGGYVGMDVNRAARIAGAAHGGQVVLSSATAELVGEELPAGVRLKDLGSHQLKDIAHPEHVLQLVVEGLPSDFPPLKTLGSASSLPVPTTPLVGRDGELAELTALLGSPQVRLVTLTGPGGSGKTRLAIGVAERLVDRFKDGLYFVDLAAATSTDVMWTTIAEVLDVPPEGRTPPAFFSHMAHRSALLVLDNLEQVQGADAVVVELLKRAPDVVVIATSRRSLNVSGELQHAVPPLGLPDDSHLSQAAESGAVRLFTQTARSVRSTFALNQDNAADVVAICRGLDGLPLAIELAAARSKLLSPHALLARLDSALDVKAAGVGRPTRQQTLRDTIDWSYHLLTGQQQALFRRLGVFAGSADLDAISAVCAATLTTDDPLDLIGELVDANLATVTEDANGEPRIGMLVTIRAYAQDQLREVGEFDTVRQVHAHHYLSLVEILQPMQSGSLDLLVEGMRRFELDHDNIREALGWALGPPDDGSSEATDRITVGLRICAEAFDWWIQGGYFAEARRWGETAVDQAGAEDDLDLAKCLRALAFICGKQGDLERAHEAATRGVGMVRRIDDPEQLAFALVHLGRTETLLGNEPAARSALEEALTLGRRLDEASAASAEAMFLLEPLEYQAGNFDRALALLEDAAAIWRRTGNEPGELLCRHNIVCNLRLSGRAHEAYEQWQQLLPRVLRLALPEGLMIVAEDYAACLADLGHHLDAVRLLGAAEAMRERLAIPRNSRQEAEISPAIDKAAHALTADTWKRTYTEGSGMKVEDALEAVHAKQRS